MISLLTGIVRSRSVTLLEVETSGGVGYEVHIPLSVFEQLPAEDSSITLYTHLAVREDAWELYGFSSRLERSVFRRVLTAKGVGPALALGIVSTIGAERVVEAIQERDIATLVRVPRVGKRKAEQIVLDLADKMDDLRSSPSAGSAGRPAGASGPSADAVRALVALGYVEGEAAAAVAKLPPNSDVASLVRGALATLSR